MTLEKANKVVQGILKDLTGRRGLRQEWEQIDGDIQQEISDTWTGIVAAALARDVVTEAEIAAVIAIASIQGYGNAETAKAIYALRLPKMTRDRLAVLMVGNMGEALNQVGKIEPSQWLEWADAILEVRDGEAT